MKPAIALCVATEGIAWHFGERLQRSFEYFHPDIPFILARPEDGVKLFGESYVRPTMGCQLISPWCERVWFVKLLKAEYDVVMMFDADVVVTARLDEFLTGGYDVAGTLNVERSPGEIFFNMGVTSVGSQRFADVWSEKLVDYNWWHRFGNEQEILNVLCGNAGHKFHKEKYSVKVADKEGCYYNERSRNYWGEIELRDDNMFCNGRHLKVMHWAGGTDFEARYSSAVFSQEVREHLDKITGTKDFTSNPGHDAHWFHR